MPRRTSIFAAILSLTLVASCELSAQPTATLPSSFTMPAPSPTPAAAPTLLPTVPPAAPTAEANPLDISAMRAKTYPGSDLVIESTLSPGPKYSR